MEKVSGLETWLETRNRTEINSSTNTATFAKSPRFKIDYKSKHTEPLTQSEMYSPIKPSVKGHRFSRSGRNNVHGTSETPGPGEYEAKLIKGNVKSCILRPVTKTSRKKFEDRVVPTEECNASLAEAIVYPASPSWSMGNGYDFSKMVEKRLRIAREKN